MEARFQGLTLPQTDRAILEKLVRHSGTPAWQFKRCRAFLLLASDNSISSVSKALGCGHRNVRTWLRTYRKDGLDAALARGHGGGGQRVLSKAEAQRIVALACSDPPEGFARWSVRLLAEHVASVIDGKRVSRERIRVVLNEHDIKPWRKKNVVRAQSRRRVCRTDERPA